MRRRTSRRRRHHRREGAMRRTARVVLGVTAMALAINALAAVDSFKRLKGPQIQARFAGMELTDGVHWGEVFGANGVLTVYSMGRKSVGKWSVKNDELCEDRGEEFKGCYQVWMDG